MENLFGLLGMLPPIWSCLVPFAGQPKYKHNRMTALNQDEFLNAIILCQCIGPWWVCVHSIRFLLLPLF